MSMASMLTKMVVAGLVAKGVGKVMGRGGSGGAGGLAGALGGMLGGNSSQQSGGGLGDLLGSLGGNSGQSSGGLGDLLGSLTGGGSSGGGGLGNLGSLLGGGQSQGGGANIGDLLSQLGGGGQQQGGIGDLLGSVLGGGGMAAAAQPTPNQEAQAEILLRAMINAAKCDGEIDQNEQQKLLEHMGDISPDEAEFLRSEMNKPLDVNELVRSVPQGMELQVYFVSLSAIDLDCKPEAQYLHSLAQGMGLSSDVVNHIHKQVGAPLLYS